MAKKKIELSVILTGRDDNYGYNFIERLTQCLENNIKNLNDSGILYELIMVDFNPLNDSFLFKNQSIKNILALPVVKNIIVDQSVVVEEQLSKNTFYEYFAKNVGARHSSGELIMFTNSDIVFSKELINSIKKTILEKDKDDVFYRTRWRSEVNLGQPFIGNGSLLDLYEPQNPDGHLCGSYSGDATMFSRKVFFDVATGYNETDPNHRTSNNQSAMDGEILWNVWKQGKTLRILDGNYYHINHEHTEHRDGSYNNEVYKNPNTWGFSKYKIEKMGGNVIMVTAKKDNKKEFIIDKNEVIAFDRSHLNDTCSYEGNSEFHHFLDPAGTSEYNLYSYLSHKFNDTIILDIGTRHGNSAVALSSNPTNKVITFDIIEWECHGRLIKENIDLRIGDFMQDETIDYNNVSIVMIDVDPHDGLQEPPMLNFLREKNWSGILLLDDIDQNQWPAIHAMWLGIEDEKFDVTDIAHCSGTGLVNFGGKYNIIIKD